MRITRLKLVNFIGIKHGMNRDEVEINFPTDGKNKITMLSGQNGSGKSTIMSQLQPYKDSFDDRKDLIVEHKEGRKEIDILGDDGCRYTIQHIYPADLKATGGTVSCFIQENGIELNPSGTVRTFEDVIKDKFGITKDYFQIGKVGTNTQSFINLTTTERKEFFSRLIPSVGKYQAAYVEATAKFKVSKDRIDDIGVSLKKFQDRKVLEASIAQFKLGIDNADKAILNYTGKKAVLESKNAELSEAMAKINFAESSEKLQSDLETLKAYAIAQQKFESDYHDMSLDDCAVKATGLRADISKSEADIKIQEAAKENSNKLISMYQNDVAKAKLKLVGMETGDLTSLDAKIKADEKNKADAENRVAVNFMIPTIKGREKDIPAYLARFEEFISYSVSHYKDLNEHDISPAMANVEEFFDAGFKDTIQHLTKDRRDAIDGRQSIIDTKNSEYGTKSANLTKLEILNKRPLACTIDSCPFISDALKYVNLPSELKTLDKEIYDAKALLKEDQRAADRLSEIVHLYDEFAIYYSAMKPRENPIIAYFVAQSKTTFSKTLQKPINDLNALAQSVISSAKKGLEDLQSITSLEGEIEQLKTRYKAISDSEKNRQYFNSEASTKTDMEAAENKKLAAAVEAILSLDKQKASQEAALKETEEYIKSKTESNGLNAEATKLKAIVDDYNNKLSMKTANDAELVTVNAGLSNANGTKTRLQESMRNAEAAITNIDALDKELASVKTVYADQKAIRESLDPRKGIPLLFVQAYLGQTEKIANELLDLAYNGKFKIIFAPTDKDFFIKVQTGTNMKDDITLASQGEIAMTTVSISLALIEQSLGRFNSVCLDEIDGPLDSENRRSFISILKSQISKMSIEQVFVISHNDAFDSESMDMILLPGSHVDRDSEFFANKRIVFDSETL